MGISHGPADWKMKKIDVEKNRRAFRRGMRCMHINRVEGIIGIFGGGSKNNTTTTTTDISNLTDESKKVYNEYIENIKENINESVNATEMPVVFHPIYLRVTQLKRYIPYVIHTYITYYHLIYVILRGNDRRDYSITLYVAHFSFQVRVAKTRKNRVEWRMNSE